MEIHRTRTGIRYIRIDDMPEPEQHRFMRYLRGAAAPLVENEPGPLAFETDWLDWQHHRRPDKPH